MKSKKRIVLAYSGGLDTSIILKWLQENYNADVICYTADIGQKINQKKIISNAKKFGVKNIIIKDVICDAFLQQILTRPKEYDVIATMNLNGDYVSDALAACVGGIGIAPGANIGDESALFEATHGTAPKYAGQDKVNPGSLILSAEMMLRHLGWVEAADLIISSMEAAITDKMVTYDFERLMDDAQLVSCSGFAKEMIKRM